MDEDILTLMEASGTINSKLISVIRIKILSSLCVLGPDGATFRELKATLNIPDGLMYSNLKVLEGMGIIRSERITLDDKQLENYKMTAEGYTQWDEARSWLCKFLCRSGGSAA
jgi:predicted transcriptional regulator